MTNKGGTHTTMGTGPHCQITSLRIDDTRPVLLLFYTCHTTPWLELRRGLLGRTYGQKSSSLVLTCRILSLRKEAHH